MCPLMIASKPGVSHDQLKVPPSLRTARREKKATRTFVPGFDDFLAQLLDARQRALALRYPDASSRLRGLVRRKASSESRIVIRPADF